MNLHHTLGSLRLLAEFATAADAQAEKNREQVRAELAEAIRTGDMFAGGDNSGVKLNELYPQRYRRPVAAPTASREQVKTELAEAVRTGDMAAAGEASMKLNEQFPQRYAKSGVVVDWAMPVTAAANAPAR